PKRRGPARLVVTVVDGDRSVRVRGASVRLLRHVGRADAHGVAQIRVAYRRPLAVTVSAPGFEARTVVEDFRASRKVVVRVYRPDPSGRSTARRRSGTKRR